MISKRDFARDGRGSVAIIVALLILPMLIALGAAIDYARFEIYRVRLQNAVDRGVLAAASLEQTQPSRATVEDYLGQDNLDLGVVLEVTETSVLNAKQVYAEVAYTMPTAFLNLIGIDTMVVGARATAQDLRRNVEISLVLDFSGSMSGDKITALRPAARDFVTAVLNEESRPNTTVSIVPYSGSVSVGAAVFNALGGARTHNNSSCFEFAAADYGTGMPVFQGKAQVPHFTGYGTYVNGVPYSPWCPREETTIAPMSNDPALLHNRINAFQLYDGTGTAVAVNWGLMLLDPSMQPLIGMAAQYGLVRPEFADRPAPYDSDDTLKFIVLMTDGGITPQFRPSSTNPWTNTQTESVDTTRARMYAVCDAAKANGVTVFTIAFKVASANLEEMRNCASSPSHFYNVEDLDIASAFRAIASAIQKVKLIG